MTRRSIFGRERDQEMDSKRRIFVIGTTTFFKRSAALGRQLRSAIPASGTTASNPAGEVTASVTVETAGGDDKVGEAGGSSASAEGAAPSACHCNNNSTAGSIPPPLRSARSHQSRGNPIASNTPAISTSPPILPQIPTNTHKNQKKFKQKN